MSNEYDYPVSITIHPMVSPHSPRAASLNRAATPM